MTFLEKLKEDNPNMTAEELDELMKSNCPDSFGYEDNTTCTNETGLKDECRGCWNREMPNTEAKEDASLKDYKYFTDDLLNQGYNKGLNDAWELARNLYKNYRKGELLSSEASEIFKLGYFDSIFTEVTPQEALAKLKAYEEAQIEVGDVLEYKDGECYSIVLKVNESGSLYLLFCDGSAGVHPREGHKKTGKHIDIASILEQIGE